MRIFINIFQCIYITYMILTLHFQQTMDVFALWWILVTDSHTTVYSVFTLRLWLSFQSPILIVRLYLCVSLCGHVHKCAGAWGGHGCLPLELGWQAVAWHLTCVLGTKLWPLGKPCELLAAEQAISSALVPRLKSNLLMVYPNSGTRSSIYLLSELFILFCSIRACE